jgi:hypothetical protein
VNLNLDRERQLIVDPAGFGFYLANEKCAVEKVINRLFFAFSPSLFHVLDEVSDK